MIPAISGDASLAREKAHMAVKFGAFLLLAQITGYAVLLDVQAFTMTVATGVAALPGLFFAAWALVRFLRSTPGQVSAIQTFLGVWMGSTFGTAGMALADLVLTDGGVA